MVDVVDNATRSRMMAAIKGRDTAPEMAVRRFFHRCGLRYRLHHKGLAGKPDIVFPRWRTVVLVHGCFWHRHPDCKFATTPSTRVDFWQQKFEQNVRRDERQIRELEGLGWRVIVVWECEAGNTDRLHQIFTEITNKGTAEALNPSSDQKLTLLAQGVRKKVET